MLGTSFSGGRSDPEAGRSAPVGRTEARTVRTCAEQFRVLSFVLRLLARFAELARKLVCKGSSPLLFYFFAFLQLYVD
jgi:hypothetical protein